MRPTRIDRALDALYAELPSINCQRKCQQSCGPAPMTRAESDRIVRRAGPPPKHHGIDCPLLTPSGYCSVYSARPMICRLWGVVASMPCPWGCIPERVLSDEEGRDFLLRAEAISEAR